MTCFNFTLLNFQMINCKPEYTIPCVQTNRIFCTRRTCNDDFSKIEIQIYCPDENEWLNCGETSKEYPKDSKVFLFFE